MPGKTGSESVGACIDSAPSAGRISRTQKFTGRPERFGLREGLLRRSRLTKNLGPSRGIGKILLLSAGQVS